jgi:hypothetical protein
MSERQCAKRSDASRMVPEEGIEPTLSQGERDFESRASASSATPAGVIQNNRFGLN